MNGPKAHRLAQALIGGDREDDDWLRATRTKLDGSRVLYWQAEVERLQSRGVDVLVANRAEYPTNLSLVHDSPPALFVKGVIGAADRKAVAVVGTRQASDAGITLAYQLSLALARAEVTIVSGLAKGIDTAAHAGALAAGGRTIAVFGTTIEKISPAKNRSLADSVARNGACVSQFLPNQSTGRWAFPARNLTTSGLAVGTIVVEAGETSGARLQAEAALAHGKQVFFVQGLVEQPWAKEMARNPNVLVSSDPDEILAAIDCLLSPVDQLLV
jgi:DNA processing protein